MKLFHEWILRSIYHSQESMDTHQHEGNILIFQHPPPLSPMWLHNIWMALCTNVCISPALLVGSATSFSAIWLGNFDTSMIKHLLDFGPNQFYG